jgi:hypothetical protein
MFTLTINGSLIDAYVGSFEDVRARAHVYFLELMEKGFLETWNDGIVFGTEIEITPISNRKGCSTLIN